MIPVPNKGCYRWAIGPSFCQRIAVWHGTWRGAAERHNGIEASIRRMDEEAPAMSETVTSVGERLPIPILPTLDDTALDLQTLQGKKVLLFMWGSW